jgi:hypothetical protein
MREGWGLKTGALLVREWNGRLGRVMILEKGFAWNGQTYLEAGSVVRLKQQLYAEDFRTPIRIDGGGCSTDGGLISREAHLQDPVEPDLRRPYRS